jgi:hypothetical protein
VSHPQAVLTLFGSFSLKWKKDEEISWKTQQQRKVPMKVYDKRTAQYKLKYVRRKKALRASTDSKEDSRKIVLDWARSFCPYIKHAERGKLH